MNNYQKCLEQEMFRYIYSVNDKLLMHSYALLSRLTATGRTE